MLLLVLIATVGAWLGFANPLLHFPLAALAFPMGLAWIGLRATTGRKAFKFGWLAGTLAGMGCYYWMVIPVQIYGGLPWYIALPCPVLLSAFIAIYYGLFSFGMYRAGKLINGIPLCLLAGVTWACMEMLMGTVFTGFPWMNLAAAFASWPFAVQGASIVGAFGLSGVLATLAVALLLYSTYREAMWLALVLMVGLTGFGLYRTSTFDVGPEKTVISLVQGNVDQGKKWDPEYQMDTIRKYGKLSLEAIQAHKPEVVVWPETAMPFYLQDKTPLRKSVEVLARQTGTPFIIGSPAYRITDMKTRAYNLYNRAWLMDSSGRTLDYYDKEHLVPFGEYMPLSKWIPFKQLVQAAGNFKPGVENAPLRLHGMALGMLICYEAIFPDLAQQQVDRGATILVNISNDAWFGKTSAPGQHLELATMRAVEQGRWLARCTNTGITAFIDPVGRVVSSTPEFKATTLSHGVSPLTGETIFHSINHWLKWFIYVMTISAYGFIAYAAIRNKGLNQ